ncbi:hypothetical protein RRF57_008029 [Xylaria bambusicola]|uniref:Uncharacterized protein n=1 Tax=Xylaria bambusicola TaxID=326684 RepID=A0AAN7Z0B1_9PEZI
MRRVVEPENSQVYNDYSERGKKLALTCLVLNHIAQNTPKSVAARTGENNKSLQVKEGIWAA